MSEHTQAVITIPVELETAVAKAGLAIDGAESLKQAFLPHFNEFHAIASRAKDIKEGSPKAARLMRLELRAIRTSAEKTRVALKEDSLLRGRAIDGIKAVLDYQLVPIENAMEAIEKAEELREAKRIADLKAERSALLQPYTDPQFYNLGGMPEEGWQKLLAGAKAAHEAKIAEDAKREADRIAAEEAAVEERAQREAEQLKEQERLREENAKLAKQAAEDRAARERQEADQAKERKRLADIAAADKRKADEAARLAKIESDKREAAAQEQARKDRAAREKAEAELAAKQKEEADKIARDKIARDKAAARKLARAPEKKRLEAYAIAIRALPIPPITDEILAAKIAEQQSKFAAWIDAEAGKL